MTQLFPVITTELSTVTFAPSSFITQSSGDPMAPFLLPLQQPLSASSALLCLETLFSYSLGVLRHEPASVYVSVLPASHATNFSQLYLVTAPTTSCSPPSFSSPHTIAPTLSRCCDYEFRHCRTLLPLAVSQTLHVNQPLYPLRPPHIRPSLYPYHSLELKYSAPTH